MSAAPREYPRNVAAERAALSAMLLDADALHEGVSRLTPEHFYVPAHGEIFKALVDLFQEQTPIDIVTVVETLRRRGTLSDVGGTEYLISLFEDVISVAAFSHYLKLIEDKYVLRRLIDAAVEIAERAASDRDDAARLLDEAEATVFSIAEGRVKTDFAAVGEVVGAVYDEVEAAAKGQGILGHVKTFYRSIDEIIGGLARQNLIILAARPGIGKTSLALNIAENLILRGVPVAVFSLEMSREALAQRMLCSLARVDLAAVRAGRISSSWWPRLSEAMAKLSQAPLYLDDSPALNILEMRAKARRIKSRRDVQLVIVDYLQMVHGYGRHENRQQEIAQVSGFLKELAKELDVPVLACAQLSRAVERRVSGEPQLSDLRESGAIEQDADVVIFLHQPSPPGGDGVPEDFAEMDVIVAKQRNGPTGRTKLIFLRRFTRFEEMYRHPHVPAEAGEDVAEAF